MSVPPSSGSGSPFGKSARSWHMKFLRQASRPHLVAAILVSVVVTLAIACFVAVTALAVTESNNNETACTNAGGVWTSHYTGNTVVGKVQIPNYIDTCEPR